MTTTLHMLRNSPANTAVEPGLLAEVVDALINCSETCTACADACLSEGSVATLTRCISLNLDCADVCATTARVLSRNTDTDVEISRTLLKACVVACRESERECARHAEHHGHCQICAETCLVCLDNCEQLLAAMSY